MSLLNCDDILNINEKDIFIFHGQEFEIDTSFLSVINFQKYTETKDLNNILNTSAEANEQFLKIFFAKPEQFIQFFELLKKYPVKHIQQIIEQLFTFWYQQTIPYIEQNETEKK
ncbi:Gp15 family bacteriophage protein [[Mycoplasma] gypis]|uniref:Gp15 family bacteriophage protein n=1 Tax=[Mycoplasma] gypis TaxID=92404 RepID=A0ABZ2RNJ3_9BACT|nr:Gp15 family bacteriophage protein [[Mycoplasma] gypis]MBN0919433.1 hypothetical protein [[Mycoplasma] gypis]